MIPTNDFRKSRNTGQGYLRQRQAVYLEVLENLCSTNRNKAKDINSVLSIVRYTNRTNQPDNRDLSSILYKLQVGQLGLTTPTYLVCI